ncbi:MAG TPA: PEP-CTERM sorting domain-containing protein [Gammaproteobacteria bacterium]|nr:PEP-CTERM sorting domain-containing protein [Gammaproteobacteria bacterium]
MANNTITISSFVSDAVLSTAASSGDVTGDLSGSLVLGDGDFFNEWLQNLTFGASFSFRLESTANGPFSPPDSFSLFLLDSSLLPYATDDPLGTDALLVLDIGNTDPEAQVFASASATATTSRGVIPVPAPSTLLLLTAGGIGMLGRAKASGKHA